MKRKQKKIISFIVCTILLLTTLCNNVGYYPLAEGEPESGVETLQTLDGVLTDELVSDDITEQQSQEDSGDSEASEVPGAEPATEGMVVEAEQEAVTAPGSMALPNSSVRVVTYVNGEETEITDATVLRNNDHIEVQLSWHINNTDYTVIDKDTDLYYDLHATGVVISNTSGDVKQHELKVGTYNIDANGILHINITDPDLLQQSDISGSVNIQGVIDASNLPEDDNGQARAEIAGTTITVKKSNPVGSPSVNKAKAGDVYTDAAGNICQDFKVTVKANTTSDELLYTDTMGGYISLVKNSFKVNGQSAAGGLTEGGQSFSYAFRPVSKGDEFEITYTVTIDKAAYKDDFNGWDYSKAGYLNKAEVEDKSGTDESTVFVSSGKTWINKSHNTNNDTGETTWTIMVNSGDPLDISGAKVTDVLPDGLKLVEGSVVIKDTSWQPINQINSTNINPEDIFNGGFVFPEGSKGWYIFEYKTVVDDASIGFEGKTYENTAKITDTDYDIEKESKDRIKVSQNWLTKTHTAVDRDAKTITWQSVIDIPAGSSATNLKYVDTLGTGLSAYPDAQTGKIGVRVSYAGGTTTDRFTGTEISMDGSNFTIPLGNVTGPAKVTVTYTTSYDPGEAKQYDFRNTAYIVNNDKPSDPVTDVYHYEDYELDILDYKWPFAHNTGDGTKVTWGIAVKNAGDLRQELQNNPDRRVYIYDTIELKDANGNVISPAQSEIALTDEIQILYWGENYGITGELMEDGRTIRFDITNQVKGNGYNNFSFAYTVDIGDKGIQHLINQGGKFVEGNSATATVEGNDYIKEVGEVEAWEKVDIRAGELLTKNYNYNATSAPNAVYTIDINPNGYNLAEGARELSLEDILGENLQLKLSTLKLVETKTGKDVTDPANISYNPDSRTLTVSNLKNATAYTLSYEVYVNVKYEAGKRFEDLDDVDVSNACKLYAGNDWSMERNTQITGNVLRSSATAESNYGSIMINKYSGGLVLPGAQFELTPYKYDSDTDSFVEYGIEQYNRDNPAATQAGTPINPLETNSDGQKLLFLKFDTLYVIRETKAPNGYKGNAVIAVLIKGNSYAEVENAIAKWNASAGNQTIQVQEKNSGDYQYIANEPGVGYTLTVKKNDQSDMPVQGAGFTLYEYNTATNTKGDEISTVYTNAKGELTFSIDEQGTYWLEETHTPAGYKSNFVARTVTVPSANGGANNVTVEAVNEKLYGAYKITKYTQDATGADVPLRGVEFGLYTEDANGVKQLVKRTKTDANGVVIFRDLEYQKAYYIRETDTLDGYIKLDEEWSFTPMGDELQNYDDTANPDTEEYKGNVVYNTAERGAIRITKTDADDTSILLSGVEFTLYDENKNVVRENGNPVTATTNVRGVAEFTDLEFGTYYVKETKAPDLREDEDGEWYQYDLNDTYYQVTIEDNGTESISITNQGRKIVAPYFNFKFTKAGVDAEGTITEAGLEGATFKLYEVENPNPSTNPDDYKTLTPVATAVSNSNGEVYFINIWNRGMAGGELNPNIRYVLLETTAPNGYIMDSEPIVLTSEYLHINYNGAEVLDAADPADLATVNTLQVNGNPYEPVNRQTSGRLSIVKSAADGATKLPGAVYGLYYDSNLIETSAASDANGEIEFASVLDYGKTYEVREITPPKGYKRSNETFRITVGRPGSNAAISMTDEDGVYSYAIDAKDEELALRISKKALTETSELPNASLQLLDSKGNEIDSWVSTTTPHDIESSKLVAGERYTLHEVSAPAGYGYSEDVRFLLQYDGNISILGGAHASLDGTTVTMRDGRINFSLAKVDSTGQRLPGARIQILSEDRTVLYTTITGSSRDFVISPALARTIGIVAAEEEGQYNYYIYHEAENGVPAGYLHADDIYLAVDHAGTVYICDYDNDNGVYSNYRTAQNNRIRMVDEIDDNYIFIRKGYYNASQFATIKGAGLKIQKWDGTEYVDMDDSGFAWSSDNSSKTFMVSEMDEAVDNRYQLVETNVPFGFRKADNIRFTVVQEDGDVKIQLDGQPEYLEDNIITMIDEPEYLNIDKQEANGNRLSGASLELIEESTNKRITNWTSGAQPNQISVTLLKNNGVYVLRETKAPYGYEKADDIVFRLTYDAASGYQIAIRDGETYVAQDELQISMIDREVNLTIGKYEVGGSEEIDGASLIITEAGTDRVVESWTTDSKSGSKKISVLGNFDIDVVYQLTEITAPYGYDVAEDIFFKVDADSEVWVSDSATGTFTEASDGKIVMEDASKKLTISKQDIVSGEEIDDAELVITDEVGKVIVPAWNSSSTEPKQIDIAGNFKEDVVYTLIEKTAPFGYEVAESIDFKLGQDGKVYYKKHGDPDSSFVERDDSTVVMLDAPKYMYISKVDITNSEMIEGAKLIITERESGEVIDEWTSSADTKHELMILGQLKPETDYVLTEITAPDGYEVAESIVFYLDESGKLYVDVDGSFREVDDDTVVMEDAPEGSVINISKRDLAGGEEIDGANLVITDEKGNTVLEWTSSSARGPKQIPKSSFEADKTYTLTETNAPNGYAYAESITFRIDSEGKLYVNGTLADDNLIVMEDAAILVTISKQDITNGKELPGAELVIRDATGEIIYSFTSGTEPTLIPSKVFKAPKPGELNYYTLTEITAPNGYEVAETIQFAIDSEGVVYVQNAEGKYVPLKSLGADKIVMFDHPTVTTTEQTTPDTPKDAPKTGDRAPIVLIIMLAILSFMGILVMRRLRRQR